MAVTKSNENKGEDTMSEEKGKYEKMFENTYEGIEHIYIRDFLSSVLLHSITRVI